MAGQAIEGLNLGAMHKRAAIQSLTRRLGGFVRGLGLDELTVRTIVETVVADMPDHPTRSALPRRFSSDDRRIRFITHTE